ncbi:cellulase family glycosylhydrolase [Paracoccus sediminicola]|uniref:cellulase family glycosylhydrolase n=1 Tax=Paracoccus sediminicola TaxID=3017783 RepID=UPI0022F0C1DC|nr:cellulase family glycosylhydrolase [Paracoccus sediminicola]WBU58188.1 cellulase family glycosylhydrolase [Paracoccus sediminicola]
MPSPGPLRRFIPALVALGLFAAQPAAAQMRSAPAETAPGTPGMAVGLNALRDQSAAELRAEFEDYVRLGVRWLRTDIYWADVQAAGPNRFDWEETDRIVDLAEEFGLNFLPVVGTTPRWARNIAEGGSTPRDPAEFARFMTAAVERYAPRGIHVWEIWNEPNLSGPWPPHPDPQAYAALLIAAYDAIHAADPDATVILGGMSAVRWTGPPFNLQHYAAPAFLREVYAAGAGDSFDAVGYHPYSYPDLPDPDWRWNGWGMMAIALRDIMEANGDAEKRIWITEFGAPSSDRNGGVTEAEQAEILREGFRHARAHDWIGPLFWYSYRDLGSDPDNNEEWFGIVNENGRRKAAWDIYQGFSNEVR